MKHHHHWSLVGRWLRRRSAFAPRHRWCARARVPLSALQMREQNPGARAPRSKCLASTLWYIAEAGHEERKPRPPFSSGQSFSRSFFHFNPSALYGAAFSRRLKSHYCTASGIPSAAGSGKQTSSSLSPSLVCVVAHYWRGIWPLQLGRPKECARARVNHPIWSYLESRLGWNSKQ